MEQFIITDVCRLCIPLALLPPTKMWRQICLEMSLSHLLCLWYLLIPGTVLQLFDLYLLLNPPHLSFQLMQTSSFALESISQKNTNRGGRI